MRLFLPEDTLQEAFKSFDLDGNGFISPSELQAVMQWLGNDLPMSEILTMIKEADEDRDGQLNYKGEML